MLVRISASPGSKFANANLFCQEKDAGIACRTLTTAHIMEKESKGQLREGRVKRELHKIGSKKINWSQD